MGCIRSVTTALVFVFGYMFWVVQPVIQDGDGQEHFIRLIILLIVCGLIGFTGRNNGGGKTPSSSETNQEEQQEE